MISAFPDPYPDELLYSICVRYCDRLQYRGKRCGLEDLFGKTITHLEWDFPSHLGELVRRLPGGHLYSVQRLIQGHTVLPFYRAFLPSERAERVQREMEGRGEGATPPQAGLGKLWTGGCRYLRYCPECVKEDIRVFGEPYWHRLHQLPGIMVCGSHRVFLEHSAVSKDKGSIHDRIVSAKQAIRLSDVRICNPANPVHAHHLRIAEDARWIITQQAECAEPRLTLKRYRVLLADRQLSTYSGSKIRHPQIVTAFRLFYAEEFLRQVGCEVFIRRRHSWISSLLRPQAAVAGMVRPPIQHLLLIQFLGHTAESFFRASLELQPFGEGPWPCLNSVSSHHRQPVIPSCSVVYTRAAGSRPRGTFACRCGFTYVRLGPDRKPEDRFRWSWVDTRGPQWDERFRKLWMDPTQVNTEVMRKLGVGQRTSYMEAQRLGLPLFRRRPQSGLKDVGVRKPRLLPRSSAAILNDRTAYLKLREASPSASAGELRQMAASLCTRVYAYDREWVKENAPPSRRRDRSGSRSADTIRWKRLDRAMVEQISGAVQALKAKPGRPVQITRKQIGQMLGWRPSQLTRSMLARFVLVRRALTRYSETWEEYAIRRVAWAAQALNDEGKLLSRSNLIPKAGLDWPTAMRHPLVRQAIEVAVEKRDLPHPGQSRRAA